jgi:catechol-2,3-dioxygenase
MKTPQSIRESLPKAPLAHLTTLNSDGSPQVTVVWVGIENEHDARINRGQGLPGGIYHFAFEAGNEAALVQKREELLSKGLKVSGIVDHNWSKSIYFRDPNDISLEYCCLIREFNDNDAQMQDRFSVSMKALQDPVALPDFRDH